MNGYNLSDKATKRVETNKRSRGVLSTEKKSGALLSNQYKQSTDSLFVGIKDAVYKNRAERIYKEKAPTIRTNCGGLECGSTPSNITECIEIGSANLNVRVRKHKIDNNELCLFLREHKNKSNKEISAYCNIPVTKVEHYFRNDKSFAIPDAEIWYKLKEILDINTDIYDKRIMEFETKKSGFDMTNRVYSSKGKSPTLTSTFGNNHEKKVSEDNITWRKLTPLECERLQNYPDRYTEGVSNSQRYKMIGNGWEIGAVTHMLESLRFREDIK